MSSPTADTAALFDDLRQEFPADRLLTARAEVTPYESDALTALRARPAVVVIAESREDVVTAVRACHRARVPFVARGSGTSLSGGAVPVTGGAVIALHRLDRILRIDPDTRVAVVEPGVRNLAISHAAATHGLYYAPDPSSQPVCTIGGNVAFNSGGAHCLKHGMTANHVLGLEVVLPDGEVVRLGGESREMTGADETGIFVGSEGLFGVALEVTVRLVARPERYQTVLAAYDSLEAAGDAVSRIIASGLLPGALEIMDRLAIEAAEAAVDAGYPRDAAAVLIVELEGLEEVVREDYAKLEQVLEASSPSSVRVARSDAERAVIWRGRKSAFSAVGRLSPDYIVQDGVVPRSRLGHALRRIEQLGESARLRVANVFHAGDGNLHPLILYDGRVPGELERAEALAGEILRLCIELGGSITGEHGVGMEKRQYLEEMFSEADVECMQRVRSAIDPAGLANRGKMFPRWTSPAALAEDAEPVATAADTAPSVRPRGVDDVRAAVRDSERVLARGGGSKTAWSTVPDGASDVVVLDTQGLAGIVEYEPEEFTITALAGTRLDEVEAVLAESGQYLPFDPLLVRSGATLGGTVAAATSGPGSLRHGGVRDFVIGVRFVDGEGRLVRGGGRVVKNAAGFDFPKLLTGSFGRLGVLVELTLKVFPAGEAIRTLRLTAGSLDAAVELACRIGGSGLDVDALEIEPQGDLVVRIRGTTDSVSLQHERVRQFAGRSVEATGADDEYWAVARELGWAPADAALVKIPLVPRSVLQLDGTLADSGASRRYGAGGHVAWVAWSGAVAELEREIAASGLRGVVVRGDCDRPLLGRFESAFLERIQRALDPRGRFSIR